MNIIKKVFFTKYYLESSPLKKKTKNMYVENIEYL